ncbi:hypothetical protein CMK17_12410 [Candidatus Poribacteria bacterium]|nr:hypothetical protein [Candidatus Poribacteria bacterium]
MNEQVEFVTMSNREKYLFDLQGFLVVKDFLSNTEVCALNEAIDANHDKRREHPKADLNGTPLDGEFGPFWHYNGMLTWLPPWCQPFRNLLAHPKVIPYLNTLLGRGWKLDHSVDVLTATNGCQGMGIHGSGNVTFNGSRFYAYQNNRMRCGLIVCEYYLTDVNPDDGGLCVIPGSHKSNLPCPEDIRMWEANQEIVFNIPAKAGDLIIFNEATSHGVLPWRATHERRVAFYRYTPKYLHYAGGVYQTQMPEWVSELTEAQQAVLEPPYIYNRPLIETDGETLVRPRREGE